ncbi:MAG: competence/damage-inducible protein A [Desulfosudaceae bacterium]
MITEILSTGNEVLSGIVADTNAAWMAGRLEELGLEVKRHTCVGDDLDQIAGALLEICGRAQLVVVTGGLGPTGDDLTSAAVARAAGLPLVQDSAALESVQRFFAERGSTMRASDAKQALLPRGAQCLVNPVGSAPGFAITIAGSRVCVLPGVPHEMKKMLTEQVLPLVDGWQAQQRLFPATVTISVFGLPESEVGRRVAGLTEQFPDVRYGIRVSFPQVFVRATTRKPVQAEAEATLAQAQAWLLRSLGEKAFSGQGLSLEAEVGRLLLEKKLTVALAESCTGGLVADLLTDTPGSSAYFLLSTVTYANQAKTGLLKVPAETIATFGAVSEETARAMARGVQRLAGADFGLAVSGIAGPGGGTPEKPVGTVCLGLAGPNEEVTVTTRQLSFQNRAMNKRLFAFAALDMLRRQVMDMAS